MNLLTLNIKFHRLHNQHLLQKTATTPENLVRYMGAMQAQDYAMVKWAIGCRLEGATEAQVEQSLNEGRIIRTHLLRPTWHVVAAEDLRWILALTAPHIMKTMANYDRQMGLDEKIHKKALKLIEKGLSDGKAHTRKELMAVLDKARISTNENRASHLMMQAELRGLACSGPRIGKQFTYMLLDARVPGVKKLSRDESLYALVERYLSARSPATVADFSWWSGLSKVDSRRAVEMLGNAVYKESIEGRDYFFTEPVRVPDPTPTLHLLPAYDEFLIGYNDRTASLDPKYSRNALTVNGIFRSVVVKDGTVIGLWSRKAGPPGLKLDFKFFKSRDRLNRKEMGGVIEEYERFLGVG